jgi:anti-sigma regulatory factor (Ser/Thr protein kinase)
VSVQAAETLDKSVAEFRHEALLYAGEDDFVRRVSAFVRDAAAADEPVLVVVGAAKIDRLRDELNGDGGHVQFADMAEIGNNPARIIPAWRQFVDERAAGGRPVRGVGEPIWVGRSPAELAECHRHESLLNLAFDGGPAWWLVCPYDTEALNPAVIEEARRTHHLVAEDGVSRESRAYGGLEAAAAPFDEPLPEPAGTVHELAFGTALEEVRRFVGRHASGLGEPRAAQLVFAAHEVAANSLRHGGGAGTVRVWEEPDGVVCEVRDLGRIAEPLAGRVRPGPGGEGGRGLWLVNQLCDLVQLRTFPTGAVVRLHVRRP